MFGWFTPRCPLDETPRRWLEQRLEWLGDEFGRDVFLRRGVVLPTEDYFTPPPDGSVRSLRGLLEEVCAYMDVDADDIELRIEREPQPLWLVNDQGELEAAAVEAPDASSGRAVLAVFESELQSIPQLIGSMAHEAARLRLLEEDLIREDAFDCELTTDLLVVFHGLGVFLANSPRAWDTAYSRWPGTRERRPESMNLPLLGHALGLAAWLRREAQPTWARHLQRDARSCFQQSFNYLLKTGDTTLADWRRNLPAI